jgi:hypothetical protein
MADTDAQRAQIIAVLKTRYFPIILPLAQNWTPEQHEKNRLSRSLAAFAIEKLAEVTPAQGANAVVDGGNDNGLDAIHFDRTKNILWVVQSKAGGAPDMGENKKFCDGIRDLISARFNKFNANFSRLQTDVEDALDSPGLVIVGCHVHLGEQGLGPHAIADLDQLKAELNQFVVRFDWKELNLADTHGWLAAEHAVAVQPITLTLRKWHGFDLPRRVYYGLVAAGDLADLYQLHGKALFEKNIRHYLGRQTVNTAITATVWERPAELFYLNNGLTAVCTTITPLPGFTQEQGDFLLTGFSVVNGAQTVGSIATARNTHGPVAATAQVLITLINVGDAAANPGAEITRARNTQNAIRGLHFAALDPQQERLRQELAISGITYLYRPSAEAIQGGAMRITMEQAAVALAALSGNTRAVVAAKKDSGQLYDRDAEYYPVLFGAGLSGIRLARAVRIYGYLDGVLAASEATSFTYNQRMFYRHGRLFIMHILARRHRAILEKAEPVVSQADQLELSRVLTELAEFIYIRAEALRTQRDKGYLAIFRNLTDAGPLAATVMQDLAAPPPPPPAQPVQAAPAPPAIAAPAPAQGAVAAAGTAVVPPPPLPAQNAAVTPQPAPPNPATPPSSGTPPPATPAP